MTREEAIEELLHMKHIFIAESDAYKALDMAIEALEENESLAKSVNDAAELIRKLQKTGKWQKYEGRFDYNWECSECECSAWEKTDYCPHCGAKMESIQL